MQYDLRDQGRRFVWKQSLSSATMAMAGSQRSRSRSRMALVGSWSICARSTFVSSRRTLGHLAPAADARWQELQLPNGVAVRQAVRTRPRQATAAASQAGRRRGRSDPVPGRSGQRRRRRPPEGSVRRRSRQSVAGTAEAIAQAIVVQRSRPASRRSPVRSRWS
jgi:hypothetical protein